VKKNSYNPSTIINAILVLVIAFFTYLFISFIKGGKGNNGSWFSGEAIDNPFVAGNEFGSTNSDNAIKKLVDQINEGLSGYNILMPVETVNRLANMNETDLKKACVYFKQKYGIQYGLSLYQFIANEFDSGANWYDMASEYKPALDRLKQFNLENY